VLIVENVSIFLLPGNKINRMGAGLMALKGGLCHQLLLKRAAEGSASYLLERFKIQQ